MGYDKKNLYELLPSFYRQQDEKLGKPLEALIGVIAKHVNILENDIDGLYNNLFIETCSDWVIPYIADLVGTKIIHEDINNETVNLRSYVANTIRYRRRKGTLSVLQDMSYDITGWPCKGVEFFKILVTTQYLNHLRPENLACPDLRNVESLDLLGSPFDTIGHTVDVRLISRRRGFYNIPNVGLFFWRLGAYQVTDSPAFNYGSDGRRYTFSQLGNDMPLFNPLNTDIFEITGGAKMCCTVKEEDLPLPIRQKKLEAYLKPQSDLENMIQNRISITKNGDTIDNNNVVVCNLSDWINMPNPPPNTVSVDPALGRIFFGDDVSEATIRVSYFYGFGGDLGGGSYPRPEIPDPDSPMPICISKKGDFPANCTAKANSILEAINQWNASPNLNAVFQICDSEIYTEDIDLNLADDATLVIKSAQNQRPIIQPAKFNVIGKCDSALCLDGLLINNSSINVGDGQLGRLAISHCTLVPGGTLKQDSSYSDPKFKSISIEAGNDKLGVTLDRTISGGLNGNSTFANFKITDSIIDCPEDFAISCHELNITNSTAFGQVTVEILEQASNTIFNSLVTVNRRQQGCVRFCYIPPQSQTPMKYKCKPADVSTQSDNDKDENVIPVFTSMQYGTPGYALLREDVSNKITEGADNECEMGAFNFLQQAWRLKNLKSGIDQYARFATEVGAFWVT